MGSKSGGHTHRESVAKTPWKRARSAAAAWWLANAVVSLAFLHELSEQIAWSARPDHRYGPVTCGRGGRVEH
jgi:hypothetical protein